MCILMGSILMDLLKNLLMIISKHVKLNGHKSINTIVMSDKKPSKYQEEIYRQYTTTNSNIFVNAGPGSGKSHTILKLVEKTPFYKRFFKLLLINLLQMN